MRARRLRPSFDALNQRITPSDLIPNNCPVVAEPVDTQNSCVVIDLDPWLVAGTPQLPPSNALQPCIDPTTWY